MAASLRSDVDSSPFPRGGRALRVGKGVAPAMTIGAFGRAVLALGALVAAMSPGATQEARQLPALSVLQSGLWEIRETGNGAPPRSICVADARALMQVQHHNLPCSRLVIDNHPRSATVHYTCPAGDFGRTTIRVESPRAAVIDTQGIDDNRPFAYRAEIRRRGSCAPGFRR
jgi:hypothetical protein